MTRENPASPIIRAKAAGVGKRRIEFDEVAIGIAVPGDSLAEARDHVERVGIVDRIEARHVDLGEFETQEVAARLEHAARFRERPLDARHVANAEGDAVGVEGLVREGQFLGVGLDEVDAAGIGGPRSLATDPQHVAVDVEHGDMRLRPALVEKPEGDIAGAAGDVEMAERARLRRPHGADEGVLPGPVQAYRHEVVHEVVAPGDRAEHVVDPSLLLVEPNGLIPEMGALVRHDAAFRRLWPDAIAEASQEGYVRGAHSRDMVDA